MGRKVALVTGASGYVATQLVASLIKRGYIVRGTVRSLLDRSKIQHLQSLFPELQVFQADLLTPGSFDEAVKGCDVVFHTASPFLVSWKDPVKDLIEPALQGTLNVLRSVEKAGTVRRVVLTSSVAAVARGKPPSYVYSEKDWNEESSVEREPYQYSKKIAEEEAWKFAKGKKWELVTILPSFVIGPPLSKRVDAVSVQVMKRIVEGQYQEKTPVFAFAVVDVRDVAEAHILAAEKKEAANHRFLITGKESLSREEMRKILVNSGKFQGYPLEKNEFLPVKQRFRLDNSKSIDILGLKYRGNEESVVEMASALISLSIVHIPAKL